MSIIYIILPLILGTISSLVCFPKKNKTIMKKTNIKIPSALFIIIWPILYILLGICWYLSLNNKTCYAMIWILNILLCSWLIVYSCIKNKNVAFLILILCLLVSILIYTCLDSNIEKYLISPLIVWLIIALLVSY